MARFKGFSRFGRLLFFPFFGLLFLVGWCMNVVGDRNRGNSAVAPKVQMKTKPVNSDHVHFMPFICEGEKQEMVNSV